MIDVETPVATRPDAWGAAVIPFPRANPRLSNKAADPSSSFISGFDDGFEAGFAAAMAMLERLRENGNLSLMGKAR